MKAVNVTVEAKEKESTERLIRRFIKKVKNAGIVEEVRERRYHRSNAEKARVKTERARKRKAKEARKKKRMKKNKVYKTLYSPDPQKTAKNED